MSEMSFITPLVSQTDLVTFCDDRVNLPRDYANDYREQINNLRSHLDRYIGEHPDLGLEKMMLSGSLAKSTALSTLRDIDVALYVKGDGAPEDLAELLPWLVERLQTTYHQIDPSKIYVDDPCVAIEFSTSGIIAEVAPIFYSGDKDDRGYLWDRTTRQRILTSIPQHLAFLKKRKDSRAHFAQVVRLVKWWAQQREDDTVGFRLRSFLIELILAQLADGGATFEDLHTGVEGFFRYVQNTGLKQRIAFTDYYAADKLPKKGLLPVEIFDPVNPANNIAADITDAERRLLVDLSDKALDALRFARSTQTKASAIECWRELMGSTFNA